MDDTKRLHILFISLSRFEHLHDKGIYTDLVRCLSSQGHVVTVCASLEKREQKETYLEEQDNVTILHVRIGNITKCKNFIEKGISTLRIESQFKNALKKYTAQEKFDLVLYATPPITLVNVVKYIKERDGAKSYLMLKDIFPQNAVDLGMLSMKGIKGIIYRYFRKKEKALYAVSDHIGCMSPANVEYVLKHNPEISKEKVGLCPNALEIDSNYVPKVKPERGYKTFLYGGNLGKPQGIPFLIECLEANMNLPDRKFIICGTGTELPLLKKFMEEEKPKNITLIPGLPIDEYEKLVEDCDVGLIFLDHQFTIPNFPSRILSYMEKGLPVLAVTDPNTDIGKIITENGFGWWCESNDVFQFIKVVEDICNTPEKKIKELGHNGQNYANTKYLLIGTVRNVVSCCCTTFE